MSVTSIASAVEVVTAFFDAYRDQDVERMVELCTDNADFHYVPFELWGRQRVIRGDGKVRTIGKEGLIEEVTAYWDTADWQRQLGWLEVG